jgi:hypothetical protein
MKGILLDKLTVYRNKIPMFLPCLWHILGKLSVAGEQSYKLNIYDLKKEINHIYIEGLYLV